MSIREKLSAWLRGENEPLSRLSEEALAPDAEREQRSAAREAAAAAVPARKPYYQTLAFRWGYKAAALLCCLLLIGFLLLTVAELPQTGEDYAPADDVSYRYIEQGISETGAVNFVAGMILDYRAFDTLGESFVLFTALTCVMILLRLEKGEKELPALRFYDLSDDPILRTGAKILVPAVLGFGVYIMLNGHLSPGGGFSGGAITGAGLILLSVAFGFETLDRFFSEKLFNTVCGCALGFYCLSKAYSFFCGANGLESGIGTGKPGAILSAGLILPLNLAVGMVVAMTMLGIYCMFRRGRIGK